MQITLELSEEIVTILLSDWDCGQYCTDTLEARTMEAIYQTIWEISGCGATRQAQLTMNYARMNRMVKWVDRSRHIHQSLALHRKKDYLPF